MTLRFVAFCLSLSLAALPARACTTALLLAIDVSQSIDSGEYRIQTDGMADALLDPEVAYALINGQVALMDVQWSGRDDQIVSIPWTQIRTDTDLERFAHASRTMRRAFVMSSTSVGALVRFAHTQFRNTPACTRQVIDISGDGNDNAGTTPEQARRDAEAAGITINALAIESLGRAVTKFYEQSVITRGGFVMTSRGHSAYADTLKRKIRREVSQALF
jgi:Ca-activated chloride channel family protein